MNIVVETVQVQLVNAWWEQVIPLAAILISLLAVGLTLYFRYADRLKLVLDTSQLIVMDPSYDANGEDDRVNVRVTNKSPTMTTEVTSLTLELPHGQTLTSFEAWPSDDKLPKVLGPGQSASVSYPMKGVGTSLNQVNPKPKWVRARADSGHKTVKGKKDRKTAANLRTYAVPPRSSNR